jgi:signal recognition particle receptor subunit beta
MGFEARSSMRSGSVEPALFEGDLQRDEPIGARLEQARIRLQALIERLSGVLGEHTRPLLQAAANQLDQRTCRIAVIGQIKAGKSTFINALTARPGLLPADINPWTAVVTSLHFRNAAAAPEHAAVFHLFSPDEWTELAEGGGRLRELTERLVPGFQPDLLRAQLEVMRKRAEGRLGAKFEKLLGQCHRFERVTPELLTDYVSAGDDKAAQGTDRRIYSDITRSADLFFNESPFAFPVTLIDTPGTNDPFLVRDEITRRSLENPDIFVFVISALQPLSAADIYMLRLLNGLHKDRIVVFINRADQLPNPASDAALIKAAVEKRLRLEFPALEIPVVYGSAWLGNLRLQPDLGDLQACLKPTYVKVLREAGLPAGIDATSRHLSQVDRSHVAAAMHMSSGLREVSAALDRLMSTSGIAVLLRQIAVCLTELVRSAEVSDRAELEAIQELLEARRQESASLRATVAQEQQSLAAFEQRAAVLQDSFQGIETHFNELIGSACQTLRNELCTVVREYADEQVDSLLDALEANPRQRTWRADMLPLRDRMETMYVAAFEQAAADLTRVEQFLYPQLKVIVASLLPDYQGNLLEAPAWPAVDTPSLSPLADKVAVELGAPWWRQWFAQRRAAEEQAEHLQRLIESDFLRIAADLAGEAEAQLRQRIDYIMQRVNAISMGLRAGIERRTAHLAREHTLLEGTADEETLRRFEHEQTQRAEECVRKQDAYTAALQQLGTVLDLLDMPVAEPPRRLQ